MTINFYYLSGSPFSWRVWLALEFKGIPYNLKILSVDAGDLKTEAFTKINPHQKAPALSHGDLKLYESAVMIDYLDEEFSKIGRPLWPVNVAERAFAKRVSSEISSFLYPPLRRLVVEVLFRKEGHPDLELVAETKEEIRIQLSLLENIFKGDYIAGVDISAADFALYPFTALLKRIDQKKPGHNILETVPHHILNWMGRIENISFFQKTYPPHWHKQDQIR